MAELQHFTEEARALRERTERFLQAYKRHGITSQMALDMGNIHDEHVRIHERMAAAGFKELPPSELMNDLQDVVFMLEEVTEVLEDWAKAIPHLH